MRQDQRNFVLGLSLRSLPLLDYDGQRVTASGHGFPTSVMEGLWESNPEVPTFDFSCPSVQSTRTKRVNVKLKLTRVRRVVLTGRFSGRWILLAVLLISGQAHHFDLWELHGPRMNTWRRGRWDQRCETSQP